uniref:Uncharacterized protein n=1 Tax=Lepeophtheirus salmonis TaxID=72036 RepID=A0A0K2V6F9_LEPSM
MNTMCGMRTHSIIGIGPWAFLFEGCNNESQITWSTRVFGRQLNPNIHFGILFFNIHSS